MIEPFHMDPVDESMDLEDEYAGSKGDCGSKGNDEANFEGVDEAEGLDEGDDEGEGDDEVEGEGEIEEDGEYKADDIMEGDHEVGSDDECEGEGRGWYGYKLVGDNWDINYCPQYQALDRQTLSLHHFYSYGLLDRIYFSGLSDIAPAPPKKIDTS